MIILTRGYPGSGKSTWAHSWVKSFQEPAEAQPQKRARVSRDDLRAHLFASAGVLSFDQENLITKVQREQVVRLVKNGYHVVIDDMNLRLKYARAWADLAVELGVEYDVLDFAIDADECCRRDFARMQGGGRYVGDKVIRDIAARFPIGRWPAVTPTDKAATRTWPVYTPNPDRPSAYIVDIDGTLAAKQLGEGSRGWHEYKRVGEDLPKRVVIDIVNALRHQADWLPNPQIIFVSGRKEHCRKQTREWLFKHVGCWTSDCLLFMREDDDNRADDIVKNEIFETCIAPLYNVLATIDDRQRVVDMWRAKGITCLQVDAWVEAGQ